MKNELLLLPVAPRRWGCETAFQPATRAWAPQSTIEESQEPQEIDMPHGQSNQVIDFLVSAM